MIENFAKLVSPELLQRCGTVFYSGRQAFSGQRDLYLMGYNPGADKHGTDKENIKLEIDEVLKRPEENWSCYRDKAWGGYRRMPQQILHMLVELERDPGKTPSSNLIFVRSRDGKTLGKEAKRLEELCWPFHEAVIRELKVRVVVCFGKKAHAAVCKRLDARRLVDQFFEQNDRRWPNEAFANNAGVIVVGVTHPSVATWTNPKADPSPLVSKMLERSKAW